MAKGHWPLTDDDVKFIVTSAQAVWNDIGYDCLRALADHGFRKPRDINTVSMSRSNVVEVVMDADRLRDQMKRDLKNAAKLSDMGKELIAAYCDMDSDAWMAAYDRMKRVVREAFPAARHGM